MRKPSPSAAADRVMARGETDFGRELNAGSVSLADAFRRRLSRVQAAETFRFHVAMVALGFVGGLIVVVPLVIWFVAMREPVVGAQAGASPPSRFGAQGAGGRAPSLLSAPQLVGREAALGGSGKPEAGGGEAGGDEAARQLAVVRSLMREGALLEARRLLSAPRLAESAEAIFMLAETFDPNVLAALGAVGVTADAAVARQHYRRANEKGLDAAARRLEALE